MIDEKIYNIAVYILLMFELILSIPLIIDSMVGRTGFEIVIILGMGHIAMFLYGELFKVRNFHKVAHGTGIIAFVVSFVPLIGFIMHIVVSYLIIRGIMKKNKKTKTD